MAELIRYALAGIANTLVGLLLIGLAVAAGLAPVPANALGYAGGMALSFVLNRGFVFRAGAAGAPRDAGQRLPGQALRYGLSLATAYGLNLLSLRSGLERGLPVMAAQALACVVYSGVLFLLCRGFVFRPRRRRHPGSHDGSHVPP